MVTLEQLDGENWGDPKETDTPLVRQCLGLRRKHVEQFTVEDLRVMLGQGIATEHLAQSAIHHLQRDPLVEGDLYPGDLLSALLRERNWPALTKWSEGIETACREALNRIEQCVDGDLPNGQFLGNEVARKLTHEIDEYLNSRS